MKITIKENIQKQEKIKLENLKPGTIIEFDINNSPIGLIFYNQSEKEILLLNHFPNIPWFETAIGWKTVPIKKILGKLSEIIIDPNQE